MLALLADRTPAGPVAWNVAIGVASLVLLAGGLTAVIKRTMRPGQALSILGVAVAVLAITALATRFQITFYRVMIILPIAAAGIAMAVAIVLRPPPRIR
jgi:peptidoglycan/LPS O-acetylase OafA/YrhL